MAAMAVVPLALAVEWKYGDWRKESAAAEEGAAAEEEVQGREAEQTKGNQAAAGDLVVEFAGDAE